MLINGFGGLGYLLILCSLAIAQDRGTFIDTRDNKVYKWVKIGEQIWMAENLNYEMEIKFCTRYVDNPRIDCDKGVGKCYENESANCGKYGRLYKIKMAREACPNGWHLPSNTEWNVLVEYAGGMENASVKLKAKSGWNDYEGVTENGTDDYGFSALPGGSGLTDDFFTSVGYFGEWWTASFDSIVFNIRGKIYYSVENFKKKYPSTDYVQAFFYQWNSVRCMKN